MDKSQPLWAPRKTQYKARQAFRGPEGKAGLRDMVTVTFEKRMREDIRKTWWNVGETEEFFQNPGFQSLGIVLGEENAFILSSSWGLSRVTI